jgi:putative copper export protein
MKKALTIVVGFIHDFATGCWASTVLAIYWLSRQPTEGGLNSVLFGLKRQLFYAGLACVVLVFVTGAGRTFTYIGDVYGKDAEQVRRKMLVIKHIILVIVFGLGVWWQYTMVFLRQ